MVKKVLLIGLLGISMMAFLGNQAFAVTVSCPSRCLTRIFGVWKCTCTSTGGSLLCGVQGSGFGNDWLTGGDDAFLGCQAEATQWMVLCENNGGNVAVGSSTVTLGGETSGFMKVSPDLVDEKGKVTVEVESSLDPATLTELQQFNGVACPGGQGDNWRIIDGVPLRMALFYVAYDQYGCLMADAGFSCELPNPDTLGVDPNTKKFEEQYYDCDVGTKNHYKCP